MSPPRLTADAPALEPVRIRRVEPDEYLKIARGPLSREIESVRFIPPGGGLMDFGKFEVTFRHYVLVPRG